MTKKIDKAVENIFKEMTSMVDDIKRKKEKRKKDIKESIELTINWLNKNKNDVDAIIVLAVKDQDVDENNDKDGLGIVCGGKLNLLNLIANIDEDLLNVFVSHKVKEKFENNNH